MTIETNETEENSGGHHENPECNRCIFLKGTNEELPFKIAEEGENRLLAAMNKWLIAHEDAQIEGAFCGLKGENVEV